MGSKFAIGGTFTKIFSLTWVVDQACDTHSIATPIKMVTTNPVIADGQHQNNKHTIVDRRDGRGGV